MAESKTRRVVNHSPRIIHLPPVIDPKGGEDSGTPGAVLIPGVPTDVDERDLARPAFKAAHLDTGEVKDATDADAEKAKKVDEDRKAENEAAAKRANPRHS